MSRAEHVASSLSPLFQRGYLSLFFHPRVNIDVIFDRVCKTPHSLCPRGSERGAFYATSVLACSIYDVPIPRNLVSKTPHWLVFGIGECSSFGTLSKLTDDVLDAHISLGVSVSETMLDSGHRVDEARFHLAPMGSALCSEGDDVALEPVGRASFWLGFPWDSIVRGDIAPRKYTLPRPEVGGPNELMFSTVCGDPTSKSKRRSCEATANIARSALHIDVSGQTMLSTPCRLRSRATETRELGA